MNTKFSFYVAAILLISVLVSCRNNTTIDSGKATLPVSMDDSSKIIIDRAIAYAGGEENWQQTKSVSFDKKSTSYDSAGHVTRETNMHLDYMMKPEFRAKLTYMLHDTAITLLHDGQKAAKLYNGKVSTAQKDIDGAWNSSFGSQFVMCMPFKLKDPGIKTEYAGLVTLSDGVPAQVVKTSFIKGAGSNPDHIWYYYFEPGTGKLLANSLNDGPTYWDYTRYDAFAKSGALLMPSARKGYTASALNKPGKLVSESRHTNIILNKDFPEDYFTIKDDK